MGRLASKRFSQQIPLTFFRVAGQNEVTVLGLGTSHYLGIDPDTRTLVNSRNTQCSVSEQLLTEQGFSTRNADGEVTLKNAFVKYADVTGIERTYRITEIFPDNTIGLIICILKQLQA